MKVVLLAGSFGTRISEESNFRPKPMIETGGSILGANCGSLCVAIQHKEFRNKGVGGLLMQKVLEEARHSGCYRVDWNVRDWNVKGINFYKKLGAKFVEDRLSMRIELDGV